MVTVYSEYLTKEIDSIVLSQCMGCMGGKDDCHDICTNKSKCIEDFFHMSMCNLDNDNMRNILCNVHDIPNSPSIEELLSNKIFVDSVKAKLSIL